MSPYFRLEVHQIASPASAAPRFLISHSDLFMSSIHFVIQDSITSPDHVPIDRESYGCHASIGTGL